MSTVQPAETELTDDSQIEDRDAHPLTVAERLAKAGEYFIDGSPETSDRDARKAALHAHWDERHRQRQESE